MSYESFYDFSWFEVWYISLLNTWKQHDLGFACIQGEKTSNSNIENIDKNILLDLLFWQKAWYETMYNFQVIF